MIVSDKHKYVFIELPRTATTAIARELIENYEGNSFLEKHSNHTDFLGVATPEMKKYRIFSCIRHPMDRVVSQFEKIKNGDYDYKLDKPKEELTLYERYYLLPRIRYVKKNDAGFADYFKKYYRLPYSDWSLLDHKRFDYIIRFESLQQDFSSVLRQLGIDVVRPLPAANRTRGKNRNFLEYYTPEIRKQAVFVFAPFMKKSGYEFPADWNVKGAPMLSSFLFSVSLAAKTLYWRFLKQF